MPSVGGRLRRWNCRCFTSSRRVASEGRFPGGQTRFAVITPTVDGVENAEGLPKRCGSDPQLVTEGMVEPVHDEQQAEQDGDRAQDDQMTPCALQAHESAQPHQYDTAEEQTGPQQPRYSGLGVEDSLIAIRRQDGQLAEDS